MAPIMTSCCCFETIQKGTIATGIYAMLTSIIAFGWVTYRIQPLAAVFEEVEGDDHIHTKAIFISYIVAVALTVCLVVSSMALIVGTMKNIRCCLVPYLIVILIAIVLQLPFTGFLLWHFIKTNFTAVNVLVHVLFSVPLICLNIASFFCVVARFQQLSQIEEPEEELDEIKVHPKSLHFTPHLTILKKHTYV